MSWLQSFIELVLHVDVHLEALVRDYGPWVYLVLFVVVFCETGLVVTPFLPGDSLLFAVGALSGRGALDVWVCLGVLLAAAVLGDTANYWIGFWLGDRWVHTRSRWRLNPVYVARTHAFMDKYGPKAVVLARFVPIVRTFTPFVAGLGSMTYRRFMLYNLLGGGLWVALLVLAGHFFGGLDIVRKNFSLVIVAIIAISLLPPVIEVLRHRRGRGGKSSGVGKEAASTGAPE